MFMLRALDRGRVQWVITVAIGAVLVTGCETGGEYSGPTGAVSGTITLNGEAAPQGCSVAFVSDDGFTASGTVGTEGSYELSVVTKSGRSSDIPVATYKVSIGPPSAGEASEADYDKMMEESSSGTAESAADSDQDAIPAKYQATGSSELSYEVKEGPNTIDIPLE